ncbi:MAG: Xaa-Pro peptidase family protein [Candidatus Omnitrophica bacterium]|nr:Xaa-Pro peptidase family protein [Candidatus Omnitrophota bacterium]
MEERIRKLLIGLRQKDIDALLVASPANISYLTKTSSHDSYFLASPKANIYFTDSRYTQQVKDDLPKTILLENIDNGAIKAIARVCLKLGLKKVGFEENRFTFAQYSKLKAELKEKITLLPEAGLIEELRQTKDPQELSCIRKALRITAQALEFTKDTLVPGKKEIEIAAEIERFIRYQGAQGSAFDIIVASGPNSSFPHHTPGQRRIRNNEPVLVDIGSDYLGYKSDLTRVFFLGKITAYARNIYNIVSEAQKRAISRIKPAVSISEIDAAARQFITKKGYGKFFNHSLGHGIGLEVHEAPRIYGKENDPLVPGEVFTVEPGIYLPGKFGIRIEDMVLVTSKGYEVLSVSVNK